MQWFEEKATAYTGFSQKTIICLTHHLDNSWKPTSWHSFQFKSNNILLIISDLISGQILMGSYLALVKKSN